MNNNGTDEPTKDLTEDMSDRQILLLLLERVTRLEAAEQDRKLETRPLWARLDGQMTMVLARLSAIEEELARMRDEQRRTRAEIKGFREDMQGERRERFYDERITELERAQQPPQ